MTWNVKEGLAPLPGIGPGPIEDKDFEELATAFGEANACTVADVKANGPYEHMSRARAAEAVEPAKEEVSE